MFKLALRHLRRSMAVVLGLGFVLVASGAPTAPGAAQFPLLSVESLVNPDGTLKLVTGQQGTVDLRGWDVTLDSTRGPILTPQPASLAAANTWAALPHDGLNNAVTSLAVSGTDVYVGGGFMTQTADGVVTNLN